MQKRNGNKIERSTLSTLCAKNHAREWRKMKELLEEWKDILQEKLDNDELAGASLLLLKDGEEIGWLGDGYADREKKVKIGRDTIFRLYSMTKPVTATAAMILAENGQLDVKAPVGDYLPEFKNSSVWCKDHGEAAVKPILVENLLSMTSGLTYGDEDTVTELATRKLLSEAEERLFSENPMKTCEFAARAGEIPLLFQPGTSWKYGISADILGAVIEKAAHKPFGEVLQEKIFEPLGMKDTGFYVPAEKRFRLAKAYEKSEDNTLVPYEGSFLGIRNSMDRKADFESGGAGLVSTIEDYAKFATMLLQKGSYGTGRILKPESVDRMLEAGLTKLQKEAFQGWFGQKGYEYGWLMRVLQKPELTHLPGLKGEYCWDGWLGCYFINYPQEKMTLLIMQQQKNGGDLTLRVKKALVQYQTTLKN